MSLFLEVTHRLGAFSLEASFSADGGVTALFGRSGSGKTTLINIIAGLIRADAGRMVLDGDPVFDTDKRLFTPPHRRRFGYVFQEARLFPHLSVRRNLDYGRWFSGGARNTAQFRGITDLLDVGPLLDRSPGNLSGGEKQRIAIGRALLSNPRLLLMDEPLAALDDDRKAEILPYLERLRDETRIPIVYVSHSVAEVARLANRVVALGNGRMEAFGDPLTVLSLASLTPTIGRRDAGATIEGVVVDGAHDPRLTMIRAGDIHLRVPRLALPAGKTVRLRIPARDVLLATTRPEGLSALNILQGTITAIVPDDQGAVDVRIACGGNIMVSRITALSAETLALRPDMPIHLIIKSVALDP